MRTDERLSNGKNDAMGDLETRMSDSNNNTSNEHKFDEIQDGISRTQSNEINNLAHSAQLFETDLKTIDEANEDIAEESPDERIRRRTSMKMQDFSNKFPVTPLNIANERHPLASIKDLYGSLLFTEIQSKSQSKDPSFYGKSTADFQTGLRKYKLQSKNYSSMFLTKSKVLIQLLSCILKQLIAKLLATKEYLTKVKSQVKTRLEGQSLSQKDAENLSDFKQYLITFTDEISTRRLELEDMWRIIEDTEGGYCHLSTLLLAFQGYIASISKYTKKIESKSKTSISLAKTKNPFILEFDMLLLYQRLYRFLIKSIVPKLFDVHAHITKTLQQGVEVVNKLTQRSGIEILSKDLQFSLSSMLDKNLRRFVKRKICLESKLILVDEDLREFFEECYELKYPLETFMCKHSLPCTYEFKSKLHKLNLFLDCAGNLSAILYNPKSLDKPLINLEPQKWITDHVLFTEHSSTLTISYDLPSSSITIKAYEGELPMTYKLIVDASNSQSASSLVHQCSQYK